MFIVFLIFLGCCFLFYFYLGIVRSLLVLFIVLGLVVVRR